MKDLPVAAALFGPLFFGLVFHGLCIKFGWLQSLAVPVDGGRQLRGRPLFGENKTFRGILVVALGAALGYGLQAAAPGLQAAGFRGLPLPVMALVGFGIGAAAMASELINSLLKRQLGVAPGRAARGPAAVLFYLFDQVDFLLGAWLVVWPWVSPTWSLLLWSIAFVVVVHQMISMIGAALGMRQSAR